MSQVNVYSSAPASTQLACAFQNLERLGMQVILRPLQELPTAPQPRPRSLSVLEDELLGITQHLVLVAEQLNEHEQGRHRLDAGLEQGLRFDRDALQTRQKAIQAAIQAQHKVLRVRHEAPS
ncbi:MAG: hypothetical protein ACRYFX_19730 [Janthinobacterium lividum]